MPDSQTALLAEEIEHDLRAVGDKDRAIGWVLRDVSKKRSDLAFSFLLDHVHEVSGLTLREGSKYLPAEQQESPRRVRS